MLSLLAEHFKAFSRQALCRYFDGVVVASKTADVEATMVHGAHGPREVYVYVITG